MALRRSLVLVVVLGLGVGCQKGSGKTTPLSGLDGAAPFPGYESPPLDELVAVAQGQGPPSGAATPYVRPAPIEVPPVKRTDLSALPKDDAGQTAVAELLGIRLIIDTSLRDPITAKGRCLALTVGCVQRPDEPNARSSDACWVHAPTCLSNKPWEEPADCCPLRCQELYQRLRELSYSEYEAAVLTGRSHCFNGLREFLGGSS